MIPTKWLLREAVEQIHLEQIAEHGGLPGLRDDNASETRPPPQQSSLRRK
jgi:death-on-curing protein